LIVKRQCTHLLLLLLLLLLLFYYYSECVFAVAVAGLGGAVLQLMHHLAECLPLQ
jgi:hypothetical protein